MIEPDAELLNLVLLFVAEIGAVAAIPCRFRCGQP